MPPFRLLYQYRNHDCIITDPSRLQELLEARLLGIELVSHPCDHRKVLDVEYFDVATSHQEPAMPFGNPSTSSLPRATTMRAGNSRS